LEHRFAISDVWVKIPAPPGNVAKNATIPLSLITGQVAQRVVGSTRAQTTRECRTRVVAEKILQMDCLHCYFTILFARICFRFANSLHQRDLPRLGKIAFVKLGALSGETETPVLCQTGMRGSAEARKSPAGGACLLPAGVGRKGLDGAACASGSAPRLVRKMKSCGLQSIRGLRKEGCVLRSECE
jgi:hypothetical protein